MKTIGKIVVLATTLALAAVLTACGGSASSSSAASSASASASAASASASAASANASASAASADSFTPGAISGDTYTNTFFGIQYKLPAGFKFQDDAYLQQMNQTVTDMLDDEAVTKALESGSAFFDMAAIGANSSNINAVVEYAGTPEAQAIDAKGYLEYTDSVLAGQLASAGATVTSSQLGTYVSSATGAEFPALKISLTMNGVSMFEHMVCLKSGNYFMNITATSADEAELDQILSNLSLLN